MSADEMRKLMEAVTPRTVEAEEPPYGDPRFSHGADDTGAAYKNQMDDEPYDIGDTDYFDWQQEMETGAVITDRTRGGYSVSVEGKHLDYYDNFDDALYSVKQWMDASKYWPNIFFVNDHGNVTHIDNEGNGIQSIVEEKSKKPKVHTFDSTGDAYDATQTDDSIKIKILYKLII